jgi:hypothetical protein
MSIRRKVRSVEIIFRDVELMIDIFKRSTQLQCVRGCGFCCKKPDIEATALEFLPLAFHYYLSGQVEEKLIFLRENQEAVCHGFREGSFPDSGYCSIYPYRKGIGGSGRKYYDRGTMPNPGVSQDLISDPQ